MRRGQVLGVTIGAALALSIAAGPAGAHPPHVVTAGETLWGIAQANGLTSQALAETNGLPGDAQLVEGAELVIPAGPATPTGAAPPTPSTAGVVPIHHPSATPYLPPGPAAAWETMRQESLRAFGIDLYPLGPLSAYRTYEQQSYFWELYQAAQGNPANPPGTSAHEIGVAVDVATPEMRWAIDQIGASFGWQKTEAPGEWWHVNYVGG